jgi:hypothetical protein
MKKKVNVILFSKFNLHENYSDLRVLGIFLDTILRMEKVFSINSKINLKV